MPFITSFPGRIFRYSIQDRITLTISSTIGRNITIVHAPNIYDNNVLFFSYALPAI
nr:MAG TPA: hypothetical protein [Caudoviricetes sp.]